MASKEYKSEKDDVPNSSYSPDRYSSLLNPFSRSRAEKEKRIRKKSTDDQFEDRTNKVDKFQEIFGRPIDQQGKDQQDSTDQANALNERATIRKRQTQKARSNSSPSILEAEDSASDGHYESTESTITEIHASEAEEEKNANIPEPGAKETKTTSHKAELTGPKTDSTVTDVHESRNDENKAEVANVEDDPPLTGLTTMQVPVIVHSADEPSSSTTQKTPAEVADGDTIMKEDETPASGNVEPTTRYRSFGSVSKNTQRSDSPLLSRTFGMRVERGRDVVAVMGAGDYGTALSVRLRNAGYHVLLLTSSAQQARDRLRNLGCPVEEPSASGDMGTPGEAAYVPVTEEASEGVIEVLPREKGLPRASLVFMTVGDRRLSSRLIPLLGKKILVDVSNRDPRKRGAAKSNAETLQSLVPSSAVVKSLNTVPAWSLLWKTKLIPKQNPTCSDAAWAVYVVQSILSDAGIPCTREGELRKARKLELIPLTFFSDAQLAMVIFAVLIFIFFLIALFRNQLCPLMQGEFTAAALFNDFMLENTKQVCGQMALMLLTLTYLPGVLAAYVQLSRGTKYKAFPGFLDAWLKARKYLGLAAALVVVHHMLTVLVSASFGAALQSANTSWMSPTALGLGIIALLLLLVQSVFSIPSVGDQMTWVESRFVLSRLGWVAYIIGTTHVILMKYSVLFNFTTELECHFIIQGFQLVLFFAVPTIGAKLVLLLPFIDSHLTDIRRGKRNRRRTSRPVSRPRTNREQTTGNNISNV